MLGLVEVSVVLFMVGISIYFYFKNSYQYWEKRNVPYISPAIPWGTNNNPIQAKKSFLVHLKDSYDTFRANGHAFGGLYLISKPALLIIEPELIKKILSKDFLYFTGHGIRVDEEKNPMSGNLFSLDGDKWRKMRIKLTPTFTSGKIKMMYHAMLTCGEPMVVHVKMLSRKGELLNAKEVLACFTTDVIGSCAFGIDCNSFKDPDSEFRKFGRQIFDLSWKASFYRLIQLIIPRLKLSTMNKEVKNFFSNSFKDIVTFRQTSKFKRNDFVQLMLEINEKAEANGTKDSLSIGQMLAQSIMFFAAGFETSSTTMTFCLHELAHKLEIQEKLRKEIITTIHKHDGKLTYDGIMQMKYLNMVLEETLRKYPPGALINRVCTKDYIIEGKNTKVEAGTAVFISILGLHRDPEYFVSPDSFNPERFSDENRSSIRSYTYLPFGEGPRICIGLRFGILQAKVGLCLLLKDFIFTPHESMKYDMEFHSNSQILSFRDDLLLKIKEVT